MADKAIFDWMVVTSPTVCVYIEHILAVIKQIDEHLGIYEGSAYNVIHSNPLNFKLKSS